MMAEQDQTEEKTEEPTAKRLEKAREDGQIARSQELSVAAIMIGVASFMYLFGGGIITNIANSFWISWTRKHACDFANFYLGNNNCYWCSRIDRRL